jgi:hypothetical protein
MTLTPAQLRALRDLAALFDHLRKETAMKDAQERLDRGAAALKRLIRAAENGAEEACAAEDDDTATKLHRMAAYMRLAYAEGRAIRTATGIQPQFGGKD